MKRHYLLLLGLLLFVSLIPNVAVAQTATPSERIYVLLGHAALFGVLGLVLLIRSYFIWDLFTPFKIREELVAKHNVSVGIVTAGIIIGTSIVIAAGLLVVVG